MTGASLASERWAEWIAVEKARQERLYVPKVAEESLLMLVMEESMTRERLEQRFRHERALVQLSLAESTPLTSLNTGHYLLALGPPSLSNSTQSEPLPFGDVDRLSEEEVEHIWQKERLKLLRRITTVNDRVQKLRR